MALPLHRRGSCHACVFIMGGEGTLAFPPWSGGGRGELGGEEAAEGMGDVAGDAKKERAPEEEHPRRAFGWAARDTSGILSPFSFSRRQAAPSSSHFLPLLPPLVFGAAFPRPPGPRAVGVVPVARMYGAKALGR